MVQVLKHLRLLPEMRWRMQLPRRQKESGTSASLPLHCVEAWSLSPSGLLHEVLYYSSIWWHECSCWLLLCAFSYLLCSLKAKMDSLEKDAARAEIKARLQEWESMAKQGKAKEVEDLWIAWIVWHGSTCVIQATTYPFMTACSLFQAASQNEHWD